MAEMQIKAESLPERCEICHQADCFDPITNSCSRCAGVNKPVHFYARRLELWQQEASLLDSTLAFRVIVICGVIGGFSAIFLANLSGSMREQYDRLGGIIIFLAGLLVGAIGGIFIIIVINKIINIIKGK